jgi:hypothetical protein
MFTTPSRLSGELSPLSGNTFIDQINGAPSMLECVAMGDVHVSGSTTCRRQGEDGHLW